MNITDDMWQAYYLCHHDHQGLSYEDAAEVMGVLWYEVCSMLFVMRLMHPDLFEDISSDGHRPCQWTVQYRDWMQNVVKKKF